MDGTNTDTHTYTGYNLAGEVLSVYDSGANINTSYEYDNVEQSGGAVFVAKFHSVKMIQLLLRPQSVFNL